MTNGILSETNGIISEVTLLPCPFCGGEASKRLFYGGRYGVYCDECSSRVGGLFDTEVEAVAAWNSRAQTVFGMTLDEVRQMMKRDAERERTCKITEYDETPYPVCSECGAVQPEDFTVHYCWNCGAKVRSE